MKGYERVRLHDGRVLSSECFSIRDEFRRITRREPYGLALAWSYCRGMPSHSIVLSKGEGLIAKSIGAQSVDVACKDLRSQLDTAFGSAKQFDKKVAATINFSPDWHDSQLLAMVGVDLLFIPELFGRDIDKEAQMVEYWLGRPREQFFNGSLNGMQERALILARSKRSG